MFILKQTTHTLTYNRKQTESVQTKGELSYSKRLPHVNWQPHGRTCAQCICFHLTIKKYIYMHIKLKSEK